MNIPTCLIISSEIESNQESFLQVKDFINVNSPAPNQKKFQSNNST